MAVSLVADNGVWFEDPDTGVLIPPRRIRKFLAWYVSINRPAGLEWMPQYVEHSGISMKEIRSWFKDQRFTAALNQACDDVNIRPDRIQAVVDMVWERAAHRGDIKAAELYLKYVGRLLPAPKRVDVNVTHSVKDMTDEQLQAELQRLHRALPAPTIDAEVISDAVQEPVSAEVDARQRARNGKAVGGSHTEGKGPSQEEGP